MNQKFQAAVHQHDEMSYVKLAGVIDEDNELTELADRIPSGVVVIDLGEIERINSCGVRDWVNWLGRIENQGARAVFVECSPAIVAQINLVNNFTGNGMVKSFFAPYFCPNCDREKVLLVEAAEMGLAPHRAPVCRCDECDGVMDFDDMEESYFAFLANSRKVIDTSGIQSVIDELSGLDGEKSRIRSRIGSNQSGSGSLPSVPSLPSIAKAGAGPSQSGSQGLASAPVSSKTGLTPISRSGISDGGRSGSGIRGTSGLRTPASRETRSSGDHRPADSGSRPARGGSGSGLRPKSDATPAAAQPRSGVMVYVLVAVLLAAIGVLTILLLRPGM